MKVLLVLILVAVLGALAGAGIYMLRNQKDGEARSKDMARALAIRVGLSITLFLVILLSWAMGWISPRGIPVAS
jgi:hypothetical protein